MGVSVAFAASASYVTVAGTSVPPQFAELERRAGHGRRIHRLVERGRHGAWRRAASVAPAAGVTCVTVGGVVSRATATAESAAISAAVSARL